MFAASMIFFFVCVCRRVSFALSLIHSPLSSSPNPIACMRLHVFVCLKGFKRPRKPTTKTAAHRKAMSQANDNVTRDEKYTFMDFSWKNRSHHKWVSSPCDSGHTHTHRHNIGTRDNTNKIDETTKTKLNGISLIWFDDMENVQREKNREIVQSERMSEIEWWLDTFATIGTDVSVI